MALCGYLKLTDQQGKMIRGNCNIQGHEHWTRISGSNHSVRLPTNSQGLPNGKRIHYPIEFIKEVDLTSPVFYKHLCEGLLFKQAQIDWYRVCRKSGESIPYFRLTLNDVKVNSIHLDTQNQCTFHSIFDNDQGHFEHLQLMYDQIVWTFLEGGIEFDDTLNPKPKQEKEAPAAKPKKVTHMVQWEVAAKDKLPVPDDYKAEFLIQGEEQDSPVYKDTQQVYKTDIDSHKFKLKNGSKFEPFIIDPKQTQVSKELKENNNIKQSVADGLISPLAIRATDTCPKGTQVHYVPAPQEFERKIQLHVSYDADIPVTFELRSGDSQSHKQNTHNHPDNKDSASKPGQPHQLTFDALDGTQTFALYAHQADLPAVEVVPAMPLADWLNKDKFLDQGIGSKGGPQLIDYQIENGHIPHLTFIPAPPQFGLFFDGTGNNKTNDNQDLDDDKEPSNIVKLSELYERNDLSDWYYSEGIGTEALESDSNSDLATAYSLDERINTALKRIVAFFEYFQHANTGFIDIFGFSRGATQARMMVNVINYLNQNRPGFWGGDQKVQTRRGLRTKN